MRLIDKYRKIDPKELEYAHLVKFVDDDIINNHLPNMQLRCTHLYYILGNLSDNKKEFIDMDSKEKYLYFKSVTDAIYYFGDDTVQTPFVLKANTIELLGIKEKTTCNKIKEHLKKLGMYFNFQDEEEKVKKKVKY